MNSDFTSAGALIVVGSVALVLSLVMHRRARAKKRQQEQEDLEKTRNSLSPDHPQNTQTKNK